MLKSDLELYSCFTEEICITLHCRRQRCQLGQTLAKFTGNLQHFLAQPKTIYRKKHLKLATSLFRTKTRFGLLLYYKGEISYPRQSVQSVCRDHLSQVTFRGHDSLSKLSHGNSKAWLKGERSTKHILSSLEHPLSKQFGFICLCVSFGTFYRTIKIAVCLELGGAV